MIHGILSVQFTHLTVFLHNLYPSFLWSTVPLGLAPSISYSIHFFTLRLSSFCSTCPNHHNMFCCNTKIILSNPSLSQNSLFGTLSSSLTTNPSGHSQLCSLKCHIIFFLQARSNFHATYCFAHNCCTIFLSLTMI